MSANDALGWALLGILAVLLLQAFIRWLFGTSEISHKLDKIIKLLEKKDGGPHV